MEWRYVLEIGNGVWTIVSLYLVVFLAYHLIVVGIQREIEIGDWIKLPLSMQLGVGMWIAALGVLISRATVTVARYSNEGFIQFDYGETLSFALGIFIGLLGFMCILRVATRPMLGHWPWVSCLACCAFYVMWAMMKDFG